VDIPFQISEGKSHFLRASLIRSDHLGQKGKIDKSEKIGEKNQRAKIRTEGQSQHPPQKLHLQQFISGLLRRLRITGSSDGSRLDI
jgi:hypothetical protein